MECTSPNLLRFFPVPCKWNESPKSWIRVLDHAPLAVHSHVAISLATYRTILDVEVLQSAAIIRDIIQAIVADHITVAQAELLQVRTALGQHL